VKGDSVISRIVTSGTQNFPANGEFAAFRMDKSILRLTGIKRHFSSESARIEPVNGVDLDIRAGEFIAIWGPPGSGKTSLLNMIGLIDAPSEGQIVVEGEDISRLTDDQLSDLRNRRIGFVFQSLNLIPVLTAVENVMLPLQLTGVSWTAAYSRAMLRLDQVGLAGFARWRPDKMSGGQRQRVALARALVINPAIVIADEPTGNLDFEEGNLVISLMRRINLERHVTFLFTTHDERLLERVDRRIFLHDGRIEEYRRESL
jgi:putative ABC transport system ATP-binding protein